MTMARIKPAEIVAELLDHATEHQILTAMGAEVSRLDLPVTVVTVPTMVQAGRVDRWAFRVQVAVTTFAASLADAEGPHYAAHDALLEATASFDGAVLISSLVCDSEPLPHVARPGADWPGLVSTYTLYMRSKERR